MKLILLSRSAAVFIVDKRVRAVDFVEVQAEDAHDLERAEAGLRPPSVVSNSGVTAVTVSPTATRIVRASASPSTTPSFCSECAAESVERSADHGGPMSVTARLAFGIDALEGDALRQRRRNGQHPEADDRRRSADDLAAASTCRENVERPRYLTDVHVGGRADDAVPHLGLDAGHEAERDHERHDADTDAGDRHGRNERNEGLPAAGGEIAAGDEPGEGHGYWLLVSCQWSLAICH